MNFGSAISILNRLLSRKRPDTFNSSWIRRHAPACYRFINKKIRAELGGIDWDRVTCALEREHQRRWNPKPRRKCPSYKSAREVNLILDKYRDKLYVFVAPDGPDDRLTRERIAISLVRVAQSGNLLARAQLIQLMRYTIDGWLDNYHYLSSWKYHSEGVCQQLEGCVRRYRYTGSFFNYVFRTLAYAVRGLRPLYVYSLDDPGATRLRRLIA
jgi:hypothetical protein